MIVYDAMYVMCISVQEIVSDTTAYEFNCIQRGHQNFLEQVCERASVREKFCGDMFFHPLGPQNFLEQA
jgi:hypothetical protein